jgi:hypothetical protein
MVRRTYEFREKIGWLEEAETLTLQMRESRERQKVDGQKTKDRSPETT